MVTGAFFPSSDMEDLYDRLRTAEKTLADIATDVPDEQVRLNGKLEGIRLAMDYVRYYRREA